jgi:hypothetical protein
MKTIFPGYYRPTPDEFTELWHNSIFVFDTNMLCNLYRYSETTQKEFLETLEKLKSINAIWLPNQAGYEFLERRLSIIDGQARQYTALEDTFKQIETTLKNDRQHPYLSNKIFEDLISVFGDATKELQEKKIQIENLELKDPIFEKITNLFENNVGTPFSKENLMNIYKEGEERFSQKIPPGWKDSSKDNKEDNKDENSEDKKENQKTKTYRRFGDLVLWFQVIDKGKSDKRNILFVTDDRKEDWWLKFKGRTFGPRPELIQEFNNKTGQKFYMYQSDSFLEYAKEHLKFPIKEETINEVKELRVLDESIINTGISIFNNIYQSDKGLAYSLIDSISSSSFSMQALQNLAPQLENMLGANQSTSIELIPELEKYFDSISLNIPVAGTTKTYITETPKIIKKKNSIQKKIRRVRKKKK